jgi:hypothetical protein
MKKISLLILLFLTGIYTLAQQAPLSFGSVNSEELGMKEYPLDKGAEAVVLSDAGKSYFIETESSFDVVFERTTRIKILTDAGIKMAEVEIPFYHEGEIYEKVYEIEGDTYNMENGLIKKTPLNESSIYVEKGNTYWSYKKFVLPEVHPGSIIEYKYKINSQYIFNLRDWEFQWEIPVKYSEYQVNMIPFYSYSWYLQGASKFDYHTSEEDSYNTRQFGATKFHDMQDKFIMTNVPAFRNEEYISSINDYIIKINFQLCKIYYLTGGSRDVITTWPLLIEDLTKNEDFGKYIVKSQKAAARFLNNDSLQKKSQHEKFDYILNLVKRNFSWNKINSKYASKSTDKLMKDKFGNSGDLNLFTIGLLNSAGIEAYPVIISTRENGKIKYDYPYLTSFNYVLISANLNDKTIISDVTEPFCQNDLIPPKCINDKGLLICKGKEEWVNLQGNTNISEQKTDITITLQNNDTETKLKSALTGYQALSYRKSYGSNDSLLKINLGRNGYKISDTKVTITDPADIKLPYVYECTFKNQTEAINNKMYVSPFLNEIMSNNPLTQSTRTYPVDMIYPTKKIYTSVIAIPDGYTVDFLPAEDKINNGLYDLNYSATSDGKSITVTFSYTFKNSVYAPADYSKVKYFFSEIVKKGNEKVVLVKS